MAENFTFYETLGIPEDATAEEIRRAYHQAARRYHPDVHRGETELFIQAQNAFDVLSDPAQRSAYDESLRQKTAQSLPVLVKTIFSRSYLPRLESEQLHYVLASIIPTLDDSGQADGLTPFHLCLVLDRSTSMLGERLDYVKSAAVELVRQLGAQDLLSIVTFSDRAEVIVPAERQPDIQKVITRIQMMRASGGTEIFKGLESGIQELDRSFGRSYVRHMILLTDGRTYGDEAACLELASEAAGRNISISGLGLGEDWNDAFLDALASRTGGSSKYLPEAHGLQNYLMERVRQLKRTFAESCVLELQVPPGVVLREAFRLEPDPTPVPAGESLHLGPIPRGGQLRFLLEYLIAPIPPEVENQRLGFGKLVLKLSGKTGQLHHVPISLSRPVYDRDEEERPTQPLVEALSKIILYRMQDRARVELSDGNVTNATRRLKRLAAHLNNQGNSELARDVMKEIDEIQKTNSISAAGEKQIKYGTRALLPSSMDEGNP